MNKYALLLKTGESELRALENMIIPDDLLPIVELTRGRRSKNDKIGQISKRLDKIATIFHDKDIILDLTSDPELSNVQIDSFFNATNGYERWISFLEEQDQKRLFRRIIPSLLVNTEDDELESNLQTQAKALKKIFNSMAYRCDIEDDGCLEDIQAISPYLNDCESYIIIDCGFIMPSDVSRCVPKAAAFIKQIHEMIPNAFFIMISTSFPDKLPEDDEYSIHLSELDLYDGVISKLDNISIVYGDYGSINPIRNDNIYMARGWRPRIDTPLKNEIYYYRRRRGTLEYSTTYSIIAKLAYEDPRFPLFLKQNWGIRQIVTAAAGSAPGASPSFWISVRMNIHIEQQLRRLGLL